MKFAKVKQQELPMMWPKIQHLVDKVVDSHMDGCFTSHGIYARIHSGQMQLWVVVDENTGVVYSIFGVAVYPDMAGNHICRIHFMAGSNLEEWCQLWPEFEMFCFENNISRMEVIGRPGLQKILPGYESAYRIFAKDLRTENSETKQYDLLRYTEMKGSA